MTEKPDQPARLAVYSELMWPAWRQDTESSGVGQEKADELLDAHAAEVRAAALKEAADALGRMDYDTDSNDYGYDTYRDAWNGGVMDGAANLRAMADEEPTR